MGGSKITSLQVEAPATQSQIKGLVFKNKVFSLWTASLILLLAVTAISRAAHCQNNNKSFVWPSRTWTLTFDLRYLMIFLKFVQAVIPTIEYDYTRHIDMWERQQTHWLPFFHSNRAVSTATQLLWHLYITTIATNFSSVVSPIPLSWQQSSWIPWLGIHSYQNTHHVTMAELWF